MITVATIRKHLMTTYHSLRSSYAHFPKTGTSRTDRAPSSGWRRIIQRMMLSMVLSVGIPIIGMGDIQTTTQTLSANVSPYGRVSVPASISLRASNTRFGGFSGSLDVSYWARTTVTGGGSVTIQANSDFSPGGGPSINNVSYTCSGATLGSACSGTQSLSNSVQTPMVSLPTGACTGGGGVCSTQEPNAVLVSFTVPSKPSYKSGNYSVQVTITISTI